MHRLFLCSLISFVAFAQLPLPGGGGSGSGGGAAATATALAANGTNCVAGNYPLGIDASGNSENCTAASGATVAAPYLNSAYGPIFALTPPGAIAGQATTLNGAINSSVTALVVTSSSGFPATPFIAQIDSENIKVTVVAGTSWTVTRAYDGTTAASHLTVAAVTEQRWQWINQGSATVTQTNGSLAITEVPNAADAMRILKKIAPAAPYSIRGKLLFNGWGAASNRAGFVFRESSTGKSVSIKITNAGIDSWRVFVDNYTNANTWSATVLSAAPPPSGLFNVFWKLEDNGTNLIFYMSADGDRFFAVPGGTFSRTAFMAGGPDEIGFFVSPINGTYGVTATLIDWT